MRHPSIARSLIAVGALVLASGACSSDDVIFRNANDINGPRGPGSWDGYYCEWEGDAVKRSAYPDYPGQSASPSTVTTAALQEADLDALLAQAKSDAIGWVDYYAKTLAFNVELRTSCTLRCEEENSLGGGYYDDSAPTAESAGSAGSSSGSSASQVSGTNNQVANVDEADFLKNDNKYMYVAANGKVSVFDAFPAEEATLLSRPAVKGTPRKLLTTESRAVVLSAVGTSSGAQYQECTYGYSCVPTGDGFPTTITVLNTTDKANPKPLREISASGSLLAARRIGSMVHVVLYDAPVAERLQQMAQLSVETKRCVTSEAEYQQEMDRITAARNQVAAEIQAMADTGPTVTDSADPAPVETRALKTPRPGPASFLSVLSFNLDTNGPVSRSTVVGRGGHVYASDRALYVAVPEFRNDPSCGGSAGYSGGCGWYGGYESYSSLTSIHAFTLGDGELPTTYAGSALVEGTVLNQFSMDEHQGHLRVATTTGKTPDPNVRSTLTVLRSDGQGLATTGMIGNIAPSEDIRSVRFDGDRGFVVTFKKTDPLFAFDLSDPQAPRIAGELKIPGFSTYMHLMDATHLLTIGYDADDHGSFAYFDGVQLQIFDVSDLNNPQLKHKEVIGTRGSSSEALTNHLAFTYFAPKQMLAIPMTICEGGGDGSFGTNMTFNGLLVYNVTVEGGFKKLGGIPLGQDSSGSYDSSLCSSWWTDANTSVKRSVIMDDYVYSVSMGKIQASRVTDLEHPVKELSLQ